MTKRERLLILVAAAMLTALATLMTSVARAQATGTIRGCFSFPYERGLMRARLEVRGLGRHDEVKVEPDGSFVMEGLSPGDYYVEMKLFGQRWTGEWVRVLPSGELHIEFRFVEDVTRLPSLIPTQLVMEKRRAVHEHDIRLEPRKVQWKSGEELGRGTRSSLFGAPSP